MAKEINFFEQEMSAEESDLPPIPEAEESNLKEVLHSLQQRQEEQELYSDARLKVKQVIEALLFASSEPVTFQKIREVADTIHPFRPKVLAEILHELETEYLSQQRAFKLEEIGQGFMLRTRKEFAPYIEQLYRNKRGEKLSQAAFEVLAIIAYRQPITKPHIEAIRGVDSTGIVQSLLERQLIEPVGRLEAPGRPTLYGITKDFLTHFGLKDLKELPKITAKGVQPPQAYQQTLF
jgi:segregation and condensation protein B